MISNPGFGAGNDANSSSLICRFAILLWCGVFGDWSQSYCPSCFVITHNVDAAHLGFNQTLKDALPVPSNAVNTLLKKHPLIELILLRHGIFAVQLRCLFRCSSANCACWYVVVLVRCLITLLLFIVLVTPIVIHDMLRSRSICVGNVLMCCACEVCYYITDAAVGGTALISLRFLQN